MLIRSKKRFYVKRFSFFFIALKLLELLILKKEIYYIFNFDDFYTIQFLNFKKN